LYKKFKNMKNIHLLPTDKPSRLYKSKITQNISMGPIDISQHGDATYNLIIYITSDEEIKEGVNQWYLDKFLNKPYNSGGSQYSSKQDVIILTTDQDLIADGVQTIDDNFLEWFVKNPSCEKVEVEHFGTCCGNQSITQCINCKKYNPVHKIIIPQEEPKQKTRVFGTEDDKSFWSDKPKQKCEHIKEYGCIKDICTCNTGPKQETLEEAAKRTYQKGLQDDIDLSFYDGVRLGAKWQSERMYSEVFEWLSSKDYLSDKMEFIQKEFEQFKKK